MNGVVELAIPCRQVILTVDVGHEADFTSLEELVARALLVPRAQVHDDEHPQHHDATSLSALFAVPHRVMINVLHTLWSKGYICIDFDSGGRLNLAEHALERLTKHQTLQDASVTRQRRSFLFEPITGRIFSVDQGDSRPHEGSLILPRVSGSEERDLPPTELLRAVQRAFRSERRWAGRRNILRVGFDNPILREPAKDLWIHEIADVQLDSESGRLRTTIRNDLLWGHTAVWRLSNYLADLVLEQPPELPFVQSLTANARRDRTEAVSAERTLAAMWSMVHELADIEVNSADAQQRVLTRLLSRLSERIDVLDRARAEVTPVQRAAGFAWQIEELLRTARKQVVFLVPEIRYSALHPLLPLLRETVDRGVRLVLVWGRRAGAALDVPVSNALVELARRRGGPVLYSATKSAESSACAVIKDNTHALVSYRSVMTMDLAGQANDVGVVISPSSDGPREPVAVTEMLRWASDRLPGLLGRRMLMRAEDFQPAQHARTHATSTTSTLHPPVLGSDADHPALKLWAQKWAECCTIMGDELRRRYTSGSVAEFLSGGTQYDAMWEALHAAERDIVISSDFGDGGGALLGVLRERLRTGTTVQVVYGPDNRSAGRPAICGLGSEKYTNAPRILSRQPAANIVCADDVTVIGCFVPLGASITRENAQSRGTNGFGLRIASHAFPTEIAGAVGCGFRSERPAGNTDDSSPVGTRTSGRSAALLVRADALRHKASGRFGHVVGARIAELDQPWTLLDAWQESGVPSDELRAAAAAFVRIAEPSSSERFTWTRWLLEDSWARGAFVEAAVLAGAIRHHRDSPFAPHAWVAAAALEVPVGAELDNAALELSFREPDEQIGGVAGALAETLLWSGHNGPGATEILQESLPDSWRTVADHTTRVAASTWSRVPLSEALPLLTSSRNRLNARARWETIASEIDKIKRLNRFSFSVGVALHRRLFEPDGLLTMIESASLSADSDRKLSASELPKDVRGYLDDEIAAIGAEPMEWSRQLAFARNIESIVLQTRMLLESGPRSETAARHDLILAPYSELADLVLDTRDALYTDANALPRPHAYPILALLDRLQPLATWAKVRR
ncbi:hypothetical protein [Nocardia sp. NPDC051833]|uniref:hypothetical protein n=1 Tax=Nocardia sp. NPDC051833 TaxID=3155674 RepID=UPI00342C9AE2